MSATTPAPGRLCQAAGSLAKSQRGLRRLSAGAAGDELARLVKVAAEGVHSLVQEAEAKNQAPRVYIHCTAGMGRAPAVACVYLVLHKGFKLNDALDHCKRHRNVCAPNWSAMENALRSG